MWNFTAIVKLTFNKCEESSYNHFSLNRLFFFYTINTHFTICPLGFSKNACAQSLDHSYLHIFVIKVANGTSLGQAALSFFDTCFSSTLRANTLNLEASCYSISKELDCWENFKPPGPAMAGALLKRLLYSHVLLYTLTPQRGGVTEHLQRTKTDLECLTTSELPD